MQFSTLQLEEMLREKGIDPDSLPTKEHDEMMKALMCSGGGGLPSGGEPNKQLVTNANGETVWEDRLAYKTGFKIEWDGDATPEDAEFIPYENYPLVKVSDDVLTAEQIIGSTITLSNGTVIIPESNFVGELNNVVFATYSDGGCYVASSPNANVVVDEAAGVVVPEAGTYFYNARKAHVVSIEKETLKPIDPEYMPDSVKSFIINVSNTDGVYSADKTFEEIEAAYNAGCSLVARTKITATPVVEYTYTLQAVVPGMGYSFLYISVVTDANIVQYLTLNILPDSVTIVGTNVAIT